MLSHVAASRSAFRLEVVISKFIFSQRLTHKWTSTSTSCLTPSTKSRPTHVLLQLPHGPQLLHDESIAGEGRVPNLGTREPEMRILLSVAFYLPLEVKKYLDRVICCLQSLIKVLSFLSTNTCPGSPGSKNRGRQIVRAWVLEKSMLAKCTCVQICDSWLQYIRGVWGRRLCNQLVMLPVAVHPRSFQHLDTLSPGSVFSPPWSILDGMNF